jgi:aldehyde dehydrogenase (NAD+)
LELPEKKQFMTESTTAPSPPTFLQNGSDKLLIRGEWTAPRAGRTMPTINPSTGLQITTIADADEADVDDAVRAARDAFEGPWSRFTPLQRQRLLLKWAQLVDQHSEELRLCESWDMGLPVNRKVPGWGPGDVINYFAGWATKIYGETVPSSAVDMFSYTRKEPVGVVGSIIPWNSPVQCALWKICPVLATGCTMVLKPAEDASLAPLRLVELLEEVGIPPGVVNVVTGRGHVVGAALVAHPGVDKIAFTGSTAVGQEIMRSGAGNLKRLSLELGGKSPNIVFAGTDLDAAIPMVAMGVFSGSGQMCCAGTRVFVERPIYDEVVDRLATFAAGLRVGNSLDPETQIGPVVSQRQLDRVLGYLDSGRSEGARVASGGGRQTGGDLEHGYFVDPTVLGDAHDDMRVVREEIFGPVVCVLPFDDTAEVIRRANDTPYGLAAGVWSRDVATAHKVAHAIRAGTVWINSYLTLDAAVPFGGYKMSGFGRELGRQGVEAYLEVKSVWVATV